MLRRLFIAYTNEPRAPNSSSIRSGTNSIDEGYRVGKLGLAVFNRFQNKAFLARFSAMYYECIHFWKEPFQDCIAPLKKAYRVGMQTGDIECALLCANSSLFCGLEISPLSGLDRDLQRLFDLLKRQKQEIHIMFLKPMWQMIQNLLGLASGDAAKLTGRVIDESQLVSLRSVSTVLFSFSYFPRILVCYLFGDHDRGLALSKESRKINKIQQFSPYFYSMIQFYDALTVISVARRSRRRRAPYAKKCSKLLRCWANHAPFNFMGKHLLLEAELASLAGEHASSFSQYVVAIAMSKDIGSITECALANELAGKYLLSRGENAAAEKFFRESLFYYRKWGAIAKVEHLLNEIKNCNYKGL